MLAAKLGVDAEEARRTYPRLAEVPFDSAYEFMATFHRVTVDGVEHLVELVKGGPDVVFARCTHAGGPLSGSQVPIAEVQADLDAANARMGEQGLRVLAFATRLVTDDELDAMAQDPMALTQGLALHGGWRSASRPGIEAGRSGRSATRTSTPSSVTSIATGRRS